ncbi:MAG: cysteine--tRNA ligase, partial [Actinomycetota bacterium]|nr:cysteine--tRNA ligase [Actinomycetota bacterium]
DVHTGGIDLRFPHHEDERAQSDAAVGHSVVRHWVHGEHLLFEGRKMAKSAGNVVLLQHIVDRGYDPLALRLAFLGTRYRTQTDLSWAAISAADQQLSRWRGRVAAWAEQPSRPMPDELVGEAVAAFRNDLDTPRALQALRRIEKTDGIPDGARFEAFAHLDQLLGLDLVRDVGQVSTLPAGAEALLAERADARAGKDWAASDRLRDELLALGVVVTDTADGQSWSPAGR